MIYKRAMEREHIFYVISVKSILGKLPVVLVGDTGTIPFATRGERARDLSGAKCDQEMGKGDGTRWWVVKNWAMAWSREIPLR